jgi:hypothetical protein
LEELYSNSQTIFLTFFNISSAIDKELCFVSGWGATSVRKGPTGGGDIFGYPDKLQVLAVSVITRSDCDKLSSYKTSDHEFCAKGNAIKKGACIVSFLLIFTKIFYT